jgi:hypothetical protein
MEDLAIPVLQDAKILWDYPLIYSLDQSKVHQHILIF